MFNYSIPNAIIVITLHESIVWVNISQRGNMRASKLLYITVCVRAVASLERGNSLSWQSV